MMIDEQRAEFIKSFLRDAARMHGVSVQNDPYLDALDYIQQLERERDAWKSIAEVFTEAADKVAGMVGHD